MTIPDPRQFTRPQPISAISGVVRGVVMLPLLDHDWTLANEFITIDRTAPDAQYARLGYKLAEATASACILKIREALKRAQNVIVVAPASGAKATATLSGLTLTATRGNSLKASITASALGEDKFDFTVYTGNTQVLLLDSVAKYGDVAGASSDWVDIALAEDSTADSALTALTGGGNATVTAADITAMLDLLDAQSFDVLAFCYDGETYESYKAAGNIVPEALWPPRSTTYPDSPPPLRAR